MTGTGHSYLNLDCCVCTFRSYFLLKKNTYEFNSHLISPFNALYHSTITTTLSSSSVQLMLSHRPKRTDVTQVLLLLLQGRRSGIGEGNRGGVPAPLPPSKFFGRSKSKTCKTCYFRIGLEYYCTCPSRFSDLPMALILQGRIAFKSSGRHQYYHCTVCGFC